MHALDRRGYPAYRDIAGAWHGPDFTLFIDHVQADPFATPSKLRLRIPQQVHRIPPELWSSAPRKYALEDFLLRAFALAVRSAPRVGGTGRSGDISIDAGGAEILPRSGCEITPQFIELRFRVGLPAAGRSILGREAATLLCEVLPRAVATLTWSRLDRGRAQEWADLAEDHAQLQEQLIEQRLIAFVRDGSILPRASGVSQSPLRGAVPFVSPPELRVTLSTLHHGPVTGMGIPEGVTLITGGGFHGKTTLLEAIQRGVYPHVPGDGREWVVTRFGAVKVRSEDGRAIAGVDLRPFIHDLPGGRSTAFFSTQDASGSTSLAAAILEAIEMGAEALLIDEDTASTNLLVRDARMQALVRKETITPLVDRVRELYRLLSVSTLLVVGGSGDYLDVCDTVILMEDYEPHDATAQAKAIAERLPTDRASTEIIHPLRVTQRIPVPHSFDPTRGRREKVRARGLRELVYGEDVIDLTALEQLVDDSQARAIGAVLRRLRDLARRGLPLRELISIAFQEIRQHGLYALEASPELALPRPFEVAGAVNRLRALEIAAPAATSAPPRRERVPR
ncbi:MAG: isopentenyl-diphosphate delta-isomerase [Chloroflexota bacterium]